VSRQWTKRAAFLIEHLDLVAASGVEDARWEHFQLAHLNDDSTFRIENKSRQIAWSFIAAAEAVAEAVLDGQSSLFTSINEDEAAEKIRYALAVYESLRGVRLPKKKRDNLSEVEFENGARLLSLPAKSARGKPRFNVYLDEFAHQKNQKVIYQGTLPVISKGGRVRIGSSPMGASDLFWEIFEQPIRAYPGYTRKRTPWWEAFGLCVDPVTARREAPKMETRERVYRFGKPRLIAAYENMPEEDFRQEYETEFVDESTAWITWEEIRANQDDGLTCLLAMARGKNLAPALDVINRLALLVRTRQIEQVFAAGVDVGRKRNTTELFLVGQGTTGHYPLRLAVTLDGMEFDDQFTVLAHALKELPIQKLKIDRTGLGMALTEQLVRRFAAKVEGVDFTAPLKQLWMTDLKMLLQQRKVPLPMDRDIAYQLHSIKRLVTASRTLVFDTERNEKHHADKAWALALALSSIGLVRRAPMQVQKYMEWDD
jgi:phage FluMu gp28-like protein